MKNKSALDRIPGGLMLAPLLLGALPILAVFYFCMRATITFTTAPYIPKKQRGAARR